MLHEFNGVMKYIGNRSNMLVCADCFKFVPPKDDVGCPKCGSDKFIPFNQLPDHDQEYVREIN
jgi:rRNA maturation endonuclease Nob1